MILLSLKPDFFPLSFLTRYHKVKSTESVCRANHKIRRQRGKPITSQSKHKQPTVSAGNRLVESLSEGLPLIG